MHKWLSEGDKHEQKETELSESMDAVLTEAVETVNNNELYTTPAFEGGQDARSVLEYAMSDIADADRQTVQERINEGQSMENID